MEDNNSKKIDTEEVAQSGSEDFFDAYDTEFDGTTSKSTFDKFKHSLNLIYHRTREAVEDASHRGKVELEIASIRVRLRTQYAKLGEMIFRLVEGEDHPNPLNDSEVRDLFEKVKNLIRELNSEHFRLEEMKKRERWTGA